MNRSDRPRIYLDHAATSWPKSERVIEAMTAYMRDIGATASRGGYQSARLAGDLVDRVRHQLARQIHAESADCITYHAGCTAALNAGIHGLWSACEIGAGDRVLVSAIEHNAVLRPLTQRCLTSNASLEIVPCDRNGDVVTSRLIESIDDGVRVIALAHASNVTGAIQPIMDVGQAVEAINSTRSPDRRILLICDAAQTLGYVPIDVQNFHVDVLAAPAHKGHGGPAGIGLLYVPPRWHDTIVPLLQGGTGNDGLAPEMPTRMPAKLEPGTLNLPAMAGWEAAMAIQPVNLEELSRYLHARLRDVPGIEVFGLPGPLPIASITFRETMSPLEAAAILDGEFGIEVRAGFHCAARIHDCLGAGIDGTLRISGGHGTEPWQIDAIIEALIELTSA